MDCYFQTSKFFYTFCFCIIIRNPNLQGHLYSEWVDFTKFQLKYMLFFENNSIPSAKIEGTSENLRGKNPYSWIKKEPLMIDHFVISIICQIYILSSKISWSKIEQINNSFIINHFITLFLVFYTCNSCGNFASYVKGIFTSLKSWVAIVPACRFWHTESWSFVWRKNVT